MIQHLSNAASLSKAARMSTMRKNALQILVALLVTTFAMPMAFAQTAEKKTTTSSQNKRTTVNFEDQLVEGQTQKPELFYLLQQRNNNFKRLIKLRENFLPEMRKTSEEMNGKGSGS
ncbi:MAG: hypothetical protein V4692_04540 [Bdellovibrionota bacterium]